MKTSLPKFHELVFALALGAMGGAICGAAILAFNRVIGPIIGIEHIRHLDPSILPLAAYHGGLIGIVVAPIGYLVFLRGVGLKKAIFPAFIGTIIGGVIGAPDLGRTIWCGVLGFFLSLGVLWLLHKLRGSVMPSN
jgi:hypothetical protein